MPRAPSRQTRDKPWAGLGDSELLDYRICELRLSLANTSLTEDVAVLYRTLERRGIRFRPHVWLSTEWFSPDGIPGIAIPFYLAHPRLTRLERRMRGEAEGSEIAARRRLLRHEAGHALDTAFGLRRRADWRAVFGRASQPYPRIYSARPSSRRYVQHLGNWYAQSHPTEDFAETFAVWLQPKARWRREYADWRALKKLEYVDRIMGEIQRLRPSKIDRSTPAHVKDNRRRLSEHYRRNAPVTDISERRYDRWLLRAFPPSDRAPEAPSAASFLRSLEQALLNSLIRRHDVGTYLAKHVIDSLRSRARELGLVVACGRREGRRRALRLHERIVDDFLRRNREYFLL